MERRETRIIKKKKCKVCGKEMIKPPNYSYKEWKKRKHCSPKCSGEAKILKHYKEKLINK